jgi:restriction endonuclease Mrr
MTQELPSSIEMRWPALVALDETAEPDAVLDLLDRVCRRLHVSDEQRKIIGPDGRTPLVPSRLVEALADLYSAGLVTRTDSGEVDITEEGRRVTEEMVVELQPTSDDLPTEEGSKPTWGDYLRAFLESI